MIFQAKTKILNLARSMILEGMSLKKIALCIAFGIALGIFPVLGMTTLLCTIAALAMRLNLAAIQVVNYMVYPLQLILLGPFYALGGLIFKQQNRLWPDVNLIELLENDFWGSLSNFRDTILYGVLLWLVLSPFLIFLLYWIVKPAISALPLLRGKRS